MASLGLLANMLNFTEADQALMIALYIAMDSFGTACNVTGDGFIALIINKCFSFKKHRHTTPSLLTDIFQIEVVSTSVKRGNSFISIKMDAAQNLNCIRFFVKDINLNYFNTPSFLPTLMKAAIARSRCSRSCAAES